LDRDFSGELPAKSCEVEPSNCFYDEIIRFHLDLPGENGRFLTEDTCRLLYIGEQSGRSEECLGERRNHNFGIRATTPGWHCPERIKIVIFTMAGQVLGWGPFEFLPREQTGPPSIIFQLPVDEDWRANEFIKVVTRFYSSHGSSSSTERTLPYPVQESTYCFHMYYCSSTAPVTDLLDRVIGFALHYGIPEGLSLTNMFSKLPDLRKILKNSRYAGGSLNHLWDYIYNQSRHEDVTRQFHDLINIARVTATGNDYLDVLPDTIENAENAYADSTIVKENIYDDPYELTPDTTGLELPHDVASRITSEFGREMLSDVRDGKISRNKAIEMVRDMISSSDQKPLPHSKTSRVILQNGFASI
jgi:hypothetical protein